MKKTTEAKNLVFDFGGVIYQIDHQKQIEAFQALGLTDFELYYSHAMQKPLFADFEKGLISEDDFRKEIKGFLKMNLSDNQVDDLWNSILVDYMPESVDLLVRLKERYRLFLLSNTNSIHYRVYINQFNKKYGYDFNTLFQKTYWSFLTGLRKPEAEIFHFVMKNNSMKREETLFIDDSLQNVDASKKAGMPSLWLKPGRRLIDFFDENSGLILE